MLVKIIAIILRNTYTTDELVERLGLLRSYYSVVLFVRGKQDLPLAEVLKGECDEQTIEILSQWIKAFKEADIAPLVAYEALDAIEEDIAGLPSVTLYVPVRFSAEQVRRLGTWFRENVQPNLLMVLRTDPRAAGGCGLIWNHTYHDLSLRYFIHKHRRDVIQMFNIYTHGS